LTFVQRIANAWLKLDSPVLLHAVAYALVRAKLIIAASLAFCFGVVMIGCKKEEPKARADPYSSDGVVRKIMEQGALLNDAVKAKDFASIDKQAYYLQGMIKALQSKLDAAARQRLAGYFDEVLKAAEELDHAAGRRHEAATSASMDKLQGLLKDLEMQVQGTKQGG